MNSQVKIEGMLDRAWFTNIANASAAISAHLPDLNWAGFYLAVEREGAGASWFSDHFKDCPLAYGFRLAGESAVPAADRKETILVHDVPRVSGTHRVRCALANPKSLFRL